MKIFPIELFVNPPKIRLEEFASSRQVPKIRKSKSLQQYFCEIHIWPWSYQLLFCMLCYQYVRKCFRTKFANLHTIWSGIYASDLLRKKEETIIFIIFVTIKVKLENKWELRTKSFDFNIGCFKYSLKKCFKRNKKMSFLYR